jgi:hypothetical protein
LKREADDAEQERRPLRPASTRYYRAVYRWDGTTERFVTTSKEIERLRAFNHTQPE